MNSKPLRGTLDWYREKAKTDENIAVLVEMIDKLSVQLAKALQETTHEK